MLIGYARVSTGEQNLDLQITALIQAGCEQIFSDKLSGVKMDRPQLINALNFARAGDTILVWRLDRFGRSLTDLISSIEQLEKRNVGFKSLHENIDTTTATGKLIFHIFSALAEFERNLNRERTMAGLNAARARGHFGGRKSSMTPEKIKIAASLMKDKGNMIDDICKTLKISRATLYRYVGPKGEIRSVPKSQKRSIK